MSVLAIDAGTTGVTALVISADGAVTGRGYQEFRQFYPQPGWVEHLPEGIWQATLAACGQALDGADPPSCVGITNQRETAVIWDATTLATPRRAIVWQDRRTAALCAQLRDEGHEARVTALTGLRLDPYFTATKLTWLARNEPSLWAEVRAGAAVVGTVDSYLIARLTGGRRHVTDASNASRTLLFDIEAGQWSAELCELFEVPPHALPEVVPSSAPVAHTDPEAFLGLSLPVAGIAGDQQAAMFGQACFAPGSEKCTYGTGSFVLRNTGDSIIRSPAGLLSTVAWMDAAGVLTYALEGSVFVTGAAVQWLRDGLGLLDNAAQSEALARSVPDSGGTVFVPALTGLGAPYWDPDARGAMFGLTRGTTRAHLVRAALEAIAFEVRDVADVMAAEAAAVTAVAPVTGAAPGAGPGRDVLRVDGGAAANDLLMQFQADQLQAPVERPVVAETTALGAAFLAGLATGVWSSPAELEATWRLDRRFEPGSRDDAAYARWREAVQRTRGWARLVPG
ncbi:MAG TPA: glycerol kinase GlpK [Streptosporangiaceae bacterium]|nr:glycerol kinase GlpK [Streptosporangiaceae bacterium]